MTMRPGAWAWVGLAASIAIVDAGLIYMRAKTGDTFTFATMSDTFADAIDHPLHRWPVIVSWTAVTLHLFKIYFPKSYHKYDPISYAANTLYNMGLFSNYGGNSHGFLRNSGQNAY